MPKLYDIVEPVSYDYQLASGGGRYDCAIVMCMEPFTLVSMEGDMLWSCTVKAENFKVIGIANKKEVQRVIHRVAT